MANHTQDGHMGQHIVGNHVLDYNQKPDVGFSTAPGLTPEQIASREIIESWVDWQDFYGTSDLTSKIKGVTWALAGDGSQAMSNVVGPDSSINGAIRITGSAGNRIEMPSDDADFDVADTDHWWTCGVYIYSSSGNRDLFLKGVDWRLAVSGTQLIATSPLAATANGPSGMTGAWKVVTCWRQADTDKTYMDVDGTVYESAGTGTPVNNISRVSVRGGGGSPSGMAFARVGFGKGAVLSEEARDYLRNNNQGRTYAEIIADSA